MPRKTLLIVSVVIVTLAGAIFGFVQIDRSNFGVPRFYVWRSLGGEFHGSRRVAVNGISLYTETYGSGPPVLVLHGAGGFLETMHYFISGLSGSHTVIAVDSRGQGRSTDGAGPITYAQMGADMIALLDALHIAQVDVVGWSDGGIIGLDMAMTHPGRVRRLVAIGANYDVKGIDPKQLDPALLERQAREIKPFYDRIAPDPSHFAVLMKKIGTLVTTQPHYTVAQLGRIRAKVLVVAGEHDIILRQHTDALARAIPGAEETIVMGASHFGPLEKPETYEEIVERFLH
ncbi:MAG: alpha/beta hydrolase [Rhizomicrobium sp.]